MKKTVILVMIITIISKVMGFGRDVTLSYFFGASNISDAYLISLTIPTVIFAIIGQALSIGYIPLYTKIDKKHGEISSIRFSNNLINILIAICTILLALGLLFTEEIVKAFASGFTGETLLLAVRFTRISLIGIYITGIVNIFSGYLQMKGNYTIPALIGFPFNIIIIFSIILSFNVNIYYLSIGSVTATLSQLILLIPFVYKKGYRYQLIFDIRDRHIKEMAIIIIPVILGVAVNEINVLVDKTIASQISTGGISALNYASKLTGFIQGIFVLSIANVLYPIISKMAADDNTLGLKRSINQSIKGISLLVFPATIGAMIFAEPIIKLLFGRGAFDSQATLMTTSALFFYSIGMTGVGIRQILSKAFYSIQDAKTPMINAAISLILNIILNIVLSKLLGIGGLALASSISAIFCTILLFISLRKKIGVLGIKDLSISFIKIFCASVVMGVFAKISYEIISKSFSLFISLVISVGVGAIVYFIVIYFMKFDEIDSITKAIKIKLSNKIKSY